MDIDEIKSIDSEHEKLWVKMDRMKAEQEKEFYMMNLILKDIQKTVSEGLVEQKKTNGRVTQLEKDYIIISTLKKNKWLLLMITIGVFKIYELIDLSWIYTKLISLF